MYEEHLSCPSITFCQSVVSHIGCKIRHLTHRVTSDNVDYNLFHQSGTLAVRHLTHRVTSDNVDYTLCHQSDTFAVR